MCGIAGIIDTHSTQPAESLLDTIKKMTDTIIHRGPDDGGAWVDSEAGVALGHRRLSIIDLSAMGHQPMISASGRYVIVFNGEIYNYKSLQAELEKKETIKWRGHSDTEVLLEFIERTGLKSALEMANGMFAFALWDRKERALTLARDRMGKKPLFYGWIGKTFLFASELKALRAYPGFEGDINRESVTLMLKFGQIPAPYSIFKGIYKLPAATTVTLDEKALANPDGYSPWIDGKNTHPESYWNAREWMKKTSAEPLDCSEPEAADKLDELLKDAVRMRMLADVPVGGFLSGGIDSSVVVALMQAQSPIPVKTFTIAYADPIKLDAKIAREVAKHLGTDHSELLVTPDRIKDLLPDTASVMDEPNADRSQMIAVMLSKLAREKVTVSLSGDGGDELFAGNPRQLEADWFYNNWMKRVGVVPNFARRAAAFTIKKFSKNQRLNNIANILPYVGPEDHFRAFYEKWWDASEVALNRAPVRTQYNDPSLWLDVKDPLQKVFYLDTFGRLVDIVLPKVDRVSMSVSLEVRCPLIDYRVVEFAARVPLQMKISGGDGKKLLKDVLYRYVPREMVDRPKQTFSMPMYDWMRGPLRDWSESLLDEKLLAEQGFLDAGLVRQKWGALLAGDISWGHQLWVVMMLQAWLANAGR